MSYLPSGLEVILQEKMYKRVDHHAVKEALDRLQVNVSPVFKNFI